MLQTSSNKPNSTCHRCSGAPQSTINSNQHQQISTNKSWHGLAHKSGSVERPWSYLATLQIYYKSLENPAESNSGNSLLFDLGVSSMALLTWRHAPPKNDSSQCLSDCQSWTCFRCPPSSSPFEEWTTCPRYGQPQFALPLHARVVWGVFKLIKCNFEFLVHAPNVRPCPLQMLQRSHAMSCIRWLQASPNCCKVYGISGSACFLGAQKPLSHLNAGAGLPGVLRIDPGWVTGGASQHIHNGTW